MSPHSRGHWGWGRKEGLPKASSSPEAPHPPSEGRAGIIGRLTDKSVSLTPKILLLINEVIQRSSCTHLQGSGGTAENLSEDLCWLRPQITLSLAADETREVHGPPQAWRMSGCVQEGRVLQTVSETWKHAVQRSLGTCKECCFIPRPQVPKASFRVGV